MLRERGFNDDRNRDLASAFWALPTGEDVLVYRKPYGGGFLLYREDEWNHKTEPAWERFREWFDLPPCENRSLS